MFCYLMFVSRIEPVFLYQANIIFFPPPFFFFFNDPAPPEIYPLSLHDPLPIYLLLLRSISELGPLPRVAERMATSQPAVTQALAELESLFGAPLFLRSARGMEPTELGALVLARARGMLADLDHWAHDIEAVGQQRAAHLQVGVIPFLPARMLADAI